MACVVFHDEFWVASIRTDASYTECRMTGLFRLFWGHTGQGMRSGMWKVELESWASATICSQIPPSSNSKRSQEEEAEKGKVYKRHRFVWTNSSLRFVSLFDRRLRSTILHQKAFPSSPNLDLPVHSFCSIVFLLGVCHHVRHFRRSCRRFPEEGTVRRCRGWCGRQKTTPPRQKSQTGREETGTPTTAGQPSLTAPGGPTHPVRTGNGGAGGAQWRGCGSGHCPVHYASGGANSPLAQRPMSRDATFKDEKRKRKGFYVAVVQACCTDETVKRRCSICPLFRWLLNPLSWWGWIRSLALFVFPFPTRFLFYGRTSWIRNSSGRIFLLFLWKIPPPPALPLLLDEHLKLYWETAQSEEEFFCFCLLFEWNWNRTEMLGLSERCQHSSDVFFRKNFFAVFIHFYTERIGRVGGKKWWWETTKNERKWKWIRSPVVLIELNDRAQAQKCDIFPSRFEGNTANLFDKIFAISLWPFDEENQDNKMLKKYKKE